MATIQEDKTRLANMTEAELHIEYEKLWTVPVQMAYGGINKGHETIQIRFLRWNKGTPLYQIEEWFRERGV